MRHSQCTQSIVATDNNLVKSCLDMIAALTTPERVRPHVHAEKLPLDSWLCQGFDSAADPEALWNLLRMQTFFRCGGARLRSVDRSAGTA
jgi:hypothetical protein